MKNQPTEPGTLPSGWEDRNNRMSEHDMKLGGMAATKFRGAKNAYEGDFGASTDYKNSDQVRDFYLSKIETAGNASSAEQVTNKSESSLPSGWETRQKERDLQSKQHGVFSKNADAKPKTDSNEGIDADDFLEPGVALVQIATHTLEKMAQSIDRKKNLKIPMEERVAFAKAMKRAMDALAKHA